MRSDIRQYHTRHTLETHTRRHRVSADILTISLQQHIFRISRLHTEFYIFLYKWILADLNLANLSSQIAIRLQITIYFGHTKEMILIILGLLNKDN